MCANLCVMSSLSLARCAYNIKKKLFVPGSILVATTSTIYMVGPNIERGMKYRVRSLSVKKLLIIEKYDGTPMGGAWSASRFVMAKDDYK